MTGFRAAAGAIEADRDATQAHPRRQAHSEESERHGERDVERANEVIQRHVRVCIVRGKEAAAPRHRQGVRSDSAVASQRGRGATLYQPANSFLARSHKALPDTLFAQP